MRRPAQFSTTQAEIISHSLPRHQPHIAAEAPPITSPAPERPWQDDGRFAITLLILVIAINLVLSTWLTGIPRTTTPPVVASDVTTKPTAPVILNELNPPESNQ